MNFIEELRNLDFNDIGRWPLPIQAFFVALFFVVATAAGFYFLVYQNQMPKLEQAEAQERELRNDFEAKQRKARVGRNPRTGQAIQIRATKTPGFRAGKGLKDAIN